VAFLEGVTLAIGSAPPPATFAAIQEAAGCFLNEAARCREWLEGCAGVPGASNPRVADLSRFLEAWAPAVERLRAGLAAARPPALEGVDWTSPEMAAEVSIHLRADSEATHSPAHGHPVGGRAGSTGWGEREASGSEATRSPAHGHPVPAARVRLGGVSEKLRGAKRPAHPPMVTRSQLLEFDWVG
jgi:hypothetical protein